jgi:hypothetical protein
MQRYPLNIQKAILQTLAGFHYSDLPISRRRDSLLFFFLRYFEDRLLIAWLIASFTASLIPSLKSAEHST